METSKLGYLQLGHSQAAAVSQAATKTKVKRSLAPVGQQLEQLEHEEQSQLELSEPKLRRKKIEIKTKHFDSQPTVAAKLKRLLLIALVMPIQVQVKRV